MDFIINRTGERVIRQFRNLSKYHKHENKPRESICTIERLEIIQLHMEAEDKENKTLTQKAKALAI